MTLTNLTVKDLGDIVEASFESEGCRVVVKIQRASIIASHTYGSWSPNNPNQYLHQAVESYLKQNLT